MPGDIFDIYMYVYIIVSRTVQLRNQLRCAVVGLADQIMHNVCELAVRRCRRPEDHLAIAARESGFMPLLFRLFVNGRSR